MGILDIVFIFKEFNMINFRIQAKGLWNLISPSLLGTTMNNTCIYIYFN